MAVYSKIFALFADFLGNFYCSAVGFCDHLNFSKYLSDRAHCPHFRPTCTFMQEGRMFVHIVYVLNVQILAPSNRIPDCTLYSVGVNSWTKSMVNVNVLFVQIFAPPRRRGEYLAIEHVYVNHALCPNVRPS